MDFNRLNPAVSRIVFALTINEALEKHLNFSMLRDAYIKITDTSDTELVSFKMQSETESQEISPGSASYMGFR